MKHFLGAILSLIPAAGIAWAADGKAIPLTDGERRFLISHLEKSRREFFGSIEGLSKEQWNFKPAPERWSVAECAEHLVLTEDLLFDMVTQKILKSPIAADVARRSQPDDEKVIARILDRTQKGKAPEALHPSGKFPTAATIKEAFNPKRDRTIEYARSTQEDLRGHSSGSMDAYQYLILLSAHTLRHTAQLNEVKTDPHYPK